MADIIPDEHLFSLTAAQAAAILGADMDERTRGAGPSNQIQPGAQSFYRSRITLDRITLHDTPDAFHVTPGMPVTADVMVGKRTVLSYIFSRALPVAMDGMREP